MKKYTFYFPEDDKEDQEFLDSKSNTSEFLRNLVHNTRIAKPTIDKDLEYDERIKVANLKKREAEANIKNWEWEHIETFDKTPSYSGQKAIKERGSNEKSFRELTEEEINFIVKHITLENTFDGYRIICKHCRLETTYKNRLEALHDSARHISAVHGNKILKV